MWKYFSVQCCPDIRKISALVEVPQASPACPSDTGRRKLSKEHWWNDTNREHIEVRAEKLVSALLFPPQVARGLVLNPELHDDALNPSILYKKVQVLLTENAVSRYKATG
jgi:hypothetical protein